MPLCSLPAGCMNDMNNNVITGRQTASLLAMFIIGSSSLMVIGSSAMKDIWLAILIAIAGGLVLSLIYARILSYLPGKDFFATLEYYLGKTAGKIFLVILTFYAFHLIALVLRNYGQFVATVGLPETPLTVIMAALLIVCVIAVRLGIEALARWTYRLLLFLLIFIVITILMLTDDMDINHILPPLNEGVGPLFTGAFGILAFPFAEIMIFLLALPGYKKKTRHYRIFCKGILIGGAAILAISVANILALGSERFISLYYPTYSALSIIQYGDFIQRLEMIAAGVFVISVFLKISVILLGASKGAAHIFGVRDYRPLVIPIALLALNYALISFDSMVYFFDWIQQAFPYWTALFCIFIPLLLLITIEMRRHLLKKKAAASRK